MNDWDFATELYNIVTKGDINKLTQELNNLYFTNREEYRRRCYEIKKHYRIFRNKEGKHKLLVKVS